MVDNGVNISANLSDDDKRFNHAVAVVLSHEGGYTNDPVDSGGETNFGITKKSYPDLDIKNLTVDDAKKIYKRDFWDKGPYKAINNIDIATKIFDLEVNMGPVNAYKIAQRALKSIGNDVAEDGDLKSDIAIINKTKSDILLPAIRTKAADYYKALVAAHPKYEKFLKGWLNRASS